MTPVHVVWIGDKGADSEFHLLPSMGTLLKRKLASGNVRNQRYVIVSLSTLAEWYANS